MTFPSYAEIIAAVHRYLITVLSDPEYNDLIRAMRKMRVEPCGNRDARVVIVLSDEDAADEFMPLRGKVFPVTDDSFAHFSFDFEVAQAAH